MPPVTGASYGRVVDASVDEGMGLPVAGLESLITEHVTFVPGSSLADATRLLPADSCRYRRDLAHPETKQNRTSAHSESEGPGAR